MEAGARVTTAPPAGAAPESVTVPVALCPSLTLLGEMPTLESDAEALSERLAVLVTPSNPAVMVAVSFAPTAAVVTENVAVV